MFVVLPWRSDETAVRLLQVLVGTAVYIPRDTDEMTAVDAPVPIEGINVGHHIVGHRIHCTWLAVKQVASRMAIACNGAQRGKTQTLSTDECTNARLCNDQGQYGVHAGFYLQ